MKRIMLVIMFVAILINQTSCTDGANAKRILKAQGYTDIAITGYDFFGCSEDDLFHTGFTAKGKN